MSKAIYIGVDNKARKVKSLYVGVDGKARKVKKGYIGVNGVARLFYAPVDRPPRLPSGYDELEYIYSDTSQYAEYDLGAYINTNINAGYKKKLILNAQVFPRENSTTTYLVQSNYSDGSISAKFNLSVSSSGMMEVQICNYTVASGGKVETVQVASNLYTQFEMIMQGDGKCFLNGIEYNAFGLKYAEQNGVVMPAFHIGTETTYYERKPRATRLYSCKIYNDGELEADFVPCKNAAGMVGMYDLVRNSFFSSATSTQFLAGPKIY